MDQDSFSVSEFDPAKARILLAYACTQRVLHRLGTATKHQPKDDYWQRYDKLIVSDHETDLSSFAFQDAVVRCNPWDNPSWSSGREFNLARCRNASIDYMLQHQYDFMIVLDVDAVIVNWPTRLVRTGCSAVDKGVKLPIQTSDMGSWYVLSNELLQTARWDERYTSYGFEDYDFSINIAQHDNKMHRYNCGVIGAHIAHTRADKYINEKGMHVNNKLWSERLHQRGLLWESRPWKVVYNNIRKGEQMPKSAKIRVKHIAYGRKTSKTVTVTYEVENTGTETWNKFQLRPNETNNSLYQEQCEECKGIPFVIDVLDPGQTAVIKAKIPKKYLNDDAFRVGVLEPGVAWYGIKIGIKKG